jgi:hypothetical protein
MLIHRLVDGNGASLDTKHPYKGFKYHLKNFTIELFWLLLVVQTDRIFVHDGLIWLWCTNSSIVNRTSIGILNNSVIFLATVRRRRCLIVRTPHSSLEADVSAEGSGVF